MHVCARECFCSHADGDFLRDVNPDSLKTLEACAVESYVADCPAGTRVQFERNGYFCIDSASTAEALTVNRVVTLKDTWTRPKEAPPPRKGKGKQGGGKKKAKTSPQPVASLSAAERTQLEVQIAAQGDRVRELKAAAKDGSPNKAEVDAAVKTLLEYKARLPPEE